MVELQKPAIQPDLIISFPVPVSVPSRAVKVSVPEKIRTLYEKVWIATGNHRKTERISQYIDWIVDFIDLGKYAFVEPRDPDVAAVASKKSDYVANKLSIIHDQKAIVLGFDVSTIVDDEELYNMSRDLVGDESDEVVIEKVTARATALYCNGNIAVVWRVGFAVSTSDQRIRRRGAIEIFGELKAFANEELVEVIRKRAIKELVGDNSIVNLAGLAEQKAVAPLRIRNAGDTSDEGHEISFALVESLIVGCCPPQVILDQLCGALDDTEDTRDEAMSQAIKFTNLEKIA